MSYDFANILLSGPCNLRCVGCIGRAMGPGFEESNLGLFPLRNLDRFITMLDEHGIRRVSLTGINTDPQLYDHEEELIDHLRQRLPGVSISVHTNGQRALVKNRTFNLYDRATLSVPSTRPHTYQAMTGAACMIDLESVIRFARIPLKVSVLLTPANIDEVPEILSTCRSYGIERVVLRKLHVPLNRPGKPGRSADKRSWEELIAASAGFHVDLDRPWFLLGRKPIRFFGGNPVYSFHGMEVTLWDFKRTRLRCLNLFPDGRISREYELG